MALLFVALSIASRFMLPEGRNINSAFAVAPALDAALIRWMNGLPTLPFLVILNVGTILVLMGPAALLFRRWDRTGSTAGLLGTVRSRIAEDRGALDRREDSNPRPLA